MTHTINVFRNEHEILLDLSVDRVLTSVQVGCVLNEWVVFFEADHQSQPKQCEQLEGQRLGVVRPRNRDLQKAGMMKAICQPETPMDDIFCLLLEVFITLLLYTSASLPAMQKC